MTPSSSEANNHNNSSNNNGALVEEDFSKNNATQRQNKHDYSWKHVALLIFTSMITFFFAGAFFGWGPMQLMLESHGAFAQKCDHADAVAVADATIESQDEEETELVCSSQTLALLNIQLVSQVSSHALSPVLGEIADRFGASALMDLSTIMACGGVALLTVSATWNVDLLLWFSFPMIGTSAVATSCLLVKTGMVFKQNQSQVISFLNSIFDSGSITYLGLRTLQNSMDISLDIIFGGYFVLAMICFCTNSYLWRIVTKASSSSSSSSSDDKMEDLDDVRDENNMVTAEGADSSFRMDKKSIEKEMASIDNDNNDTENKPDEIISTTNGEEGGDNQVFLNELTAAGSDPNYIIVSKRPPLDQLRSGQFLLLAGFFAFNVAKTLLILTTAKDFLAYLGDNETGNKYITIFTLLMPASVLGLPFVHWVLQHRRFGFEGGFQMINTLSLIHGLIQISSKSLNVQVLGFVVFSFYRCFLFSISFSYLPTLIAANVTGKANGVMVLGSSIVLFINVPLTNWAVRTFDGSFFVPYLFYELFTIPWVFLVWIMGKHMKKERANNNSGL